MNEEIKVRTGEQLERENYLLLYKSKAQILNILIDAEEEIKRLKKQNEFLMKQDNILQSLMQWIYSELNYDKNLYNPDSEEYRTGQKHYPDDTLDGFKIVIDKIKELKEKICN